MVVQTLKWIGGIDGRLRIIDQRELPGKTVFLSCTDVRQVHDAIKTLAVRGAPAIGVAAGYGLVLALRGAGTTAQALSRLWKARDYLASSRPTAVNLFHALDAVVQAARDSIAEHPHTSTAQLQQAVLRKANALRDEDIEMCRMIGVNGAKLIRNGSTILTHCNAGALATAGQGTALSILYEARKRRKRFKVFADETRPLLQGARLTAWELSRGGIETTVICDNMAGYLMQQGEIDLVITGADRIAANGDTANKIGTYSLSVLAKAHKIPFYVAAPSSTFDLDIASGDDILIEQRSAGEVCYCGGLRTVPKDVKICNPAFDITPAKNITALITERGLIRNPTSRSIISHLR